MPNSRFALHGLAPLIHGLCAFFASNSRFMRLFQAALDTCLDSPFFCQPLSSRFALHGLRALDEWRKYRVVPRAHPSRPRKSACFNRTGCKEAFRLPGATCDHFRCTVEPSSGHIQCRYSWSLSTCQRVPNPNYQTSTLVPNTHTHTHTHTHTRPKNLLRLGCRNNLARHKKKPQTLKLTSRGYFCACFLKVILGGSLKRTSGNKHKF